ncbi:TPA: hypothetical protein ACGSUT_004840, partial [Vibrio parahaemolyticus]
GIKCCQSLCLSVSMLDFTPESSCLSRSLRWHYMRSACCNFIVYGFSLAGYLSGVASLVLRDLRQKVRISGTVVKVRSSSSLLI